MYNQALHIDRKGRGLVACCSLRCFWCLLQTPIPLAASELGRSRRAARGANVRAELRSERQVRLGPETNNEGSDDPKLRDAPRA